jgi:hypothetical protein
MEMIERDASFDLVFSLASCKTNGQAKSKSGFRFASKKQMTN